MAPRLVACPSCSQHIKLDESHCLHCGARLRSDGGVIGRTAGAMLMGLSLTACPADDSSDTQGSSNTNAGTNTASSSGSTGGSTTDPDPTTIASEAEYGVGESGPFDSTGIDVPTTGEQTTGATGGTTGSDTDIGTTGAEPEYGVADTGVLTTTGAEPEYGVPATSGPEPDYGVPDGP